MHIYLAGGNDSNNLLVPMSRYASYAAARGSLAISASELLPARSFDGVEIGFHPATVGLRDLFELGALAPVLNVGSLRDPKGSAQDPDVAYIKGGFFTSQPAASISRALIGSFADGAVTGFLNKSGNPSSLNFLGTNVAAAAKRSILNAASSSSIKLATPFPATSLGQQLLQVARVLKSGVTNGTQNQLFFAVHGNYDLHRNQLERHATLLSELSEAMSAFYRATVEIGVSRSVTTFTDSPYGRTLKVNSTGGSDHAWSSHQLVMGGSVLGGKLHGEFPDLQSNILVPKISRSSYIASLAIWNGASYGDTYRVLPEADLASVQFLA